jgi:hypothetical protein
MAKNEKSSILRDFERGRLQKNNNNFCPFDWTKLNCSYVRVLRHPIRTHAKRIYNSLCMWPWRQITPIFDWSVPKFC